MIIAFGYKKEVGKNTAAKFLSTFLRCEYPGKIIKEISFAAKIKDVAYQLFKWGEMKRGVYYESHYREKEIILPRLNLCPRDIWIKIGNTMREIDNDVWVNCALDVYADFKIITDLRFKNEANIIKKYNGKLIKINRDVPQGTDPAEIDLDDWTDWDKIIDNNGFLNELNEEVISLIK